MLYFLKSLQTRHWSRSIAWLLGTGLLHLTGVALVYVGIWWMMLPPETHSALREAAAHGIFYDQPTSLILHAGLSASFWAMLVIAFKLFTAPSEKRSARLVKARGTVIVETLIVFPVFLLITLGLLQLTILNTAGLLTHLAAFKAGRAVSVWAPEAHHGRKGVNYTTMNEKARTAAAAALAPVAPSDFVYSCDQNNSLETMLEALRTVGHITTLNPNVKLHGSRSNLSVSRAFDHSNFIIRGQRKLEFAFCAVEVEVDPPNPGPATNFNVVVTYRQQMAMPFVEVVFGSFDEVGGRAAFYTTIQRRHATTSQIEPNDSTPGLDIF